MTFGMRTGGGDSEFIRLIAALGICLMLCAPLYIGTYDVDAAGSGTQDDPYRESCSDGFNYTNIYIEIGTEVYLSSMGATPYEDGYMDEGSGLTFYFNTRKGMYDLTGTASTVGDYNIYLYDMLDGYIVANTIHVVEASASATLEFLSDPVSDGIVTYVS